MPISIFSYVFLGFLVISLIVLIIVEFVKEPFEYLVIRNYINISGRKQPSFEDCIDQWIIDNQEYSLSKIYDYELKKWDTECKTYLESTLLWRGRKRRKYEEIRKEVVDRSYPIFQFVFIRKQTRYKQVNYTKTSYEIDNVVKIVGKTLFEMLEIDDELEEIDYETTREKYNAKNQRKLMTRALRVKIMKRDNYTCQKCGKYMPDEVGLHVDHIVAIKNGGKTVESNLQVLCDKCNMRKGAKKVVKTPRKLNV